MWRSHIWSGCENCQGYAHPC